MERNENQAMRIIRVYSGKCPAEKLQEYYMKFIATLRHAQNNDHLRHLDYKSKNFLSVHELLEDRYELYEDSFDRFSELGRGRGYIINTTLSRILEISEIKEVNVESNDYITDSLNDSYVISVMGNKLLDMLSKEDCQSGDIENALGDFLEKLSSLNYKFKSMQLEC